jgi:hypothetical protein
MGLPKGPRSSIAIPPNTTGLRRRRPYIQSIAIVAQKHPSTLSDKIHSAPITGPTTGIRSIRKHQPLAASSHPIHELLIGKHNFKYTPINLTVYTAAYSGAVSGLVGSSRWLLDTASADYAGFASIAGAFAESFDLVWETSPDTNPPDTLQVFIIEKACKAVWESRDTLVNTTTLNPNTFTRVSEAIIALILASETYFTGQGITPAPWPSGSGDGATGATGPVGATGPAGLAKAIKF